MTTETVNENRKPQLIITVDNSPESRTLKRVLGNRGVLYKTIYGYPKLESPLPSIETVFGKVAGWHHIKLYFLTPEECKLEPDNE